MHVLILLFAGLSSDSHRLTHEDFFVRERAQRRLSEWGVWALPVILEACHSDDLERANRGRRLLEEIIKPTLEDAPSLMAFPLWGKTSHKTKNPQRPHHQPRAVWALINNKSVPTFIQTPIWLYNKSPDELRDGWYHVDIGWLKEQTRELYKKSLLRGAPKWMLDALIYWGKVRESEWVCDE